MVRTGRRSLDHLQRGVSAEQLALRHLRAQGLKPVERNFRCRFGEIDLVMLDADTLVFVEVRFRNSNSFVSAAHTVDARKRRKLTSAARYFLGRRRKYQNHVCRFDVIGVRRSGGEVDITWLRDAFRPGA